MWTPDTVQHLVSETIATVALAFLLVRFISGLMGFYGKDD